MATQVTIRENVLEILEVLGEGQTVSAEDATKVDAAIDRVLEWTVAKNYAYWGDAVTDIPDEALDFFEVIVASRVGPKFGRFDIPEDRAVEELRKLGATSISGEPVVADYF